MLPPVDFLPLATGCVAQVVRLGLPDGRLASCEDKIAAAITCFASQTVDRGHAGAV